MAKIINGEKRGRPGRWLLDFYDHYGKRRWETFATQREAKAALEERLRDVRKGTYRPQREMPLLRDVAAAWIANRQDRQPATIADYEWRLDTYVVPELGALRVDRITTETVERFRDKIRKDLEPRTVNKILTTLTSIFDRAVRDRLIDYNPAKLAERCRAAAETVTETDADAEADALDPKEVPSAAEVRKLVENASAGLFRTYFLTAALTGAREGELLALHWPEVDLEKATIRIRWKVTWARSKADREAGVRGARIFALKTKRSRRTIPIPPELVLALKEWNLACGRPQKGLVFPKADGSAMQRTTLHDDGLHPALARAELRHLTVHSLRHFFASMLAAQGRPATEVAGYLGHASSDITQRVYQHWFRRERTDAVDQLAAAVFATSATGDGSKTVSATARP